MGIKYNILIWAEDAGKFAKEYKAKNINETIKEIFILGEELKVGDFKLLQELGEFLVIDNEYAKTKEATEVFMLGRCFEQSLSDDTQIGLISFSSLSKEATEIAKNLNIPIISWNAFGKEPSKRNNRKKTTTLTTEIKVKMPKVKEKPLTNESNIEKKTKSNKKNTELKKIIESSTLSSKDKQYFSTPEMLIIIEKAVKNASDANIGLPFQLKMHLGEKGEVLYDILKDHFNILRK